VKAWPSVRGASSTINLTFNSGSMIATTAITSSLGAVYWWLAAHEFPVGAVGLAGALISAMTLLGMVSTSGFITALIPEFANHGAVWKVALILGALVTASAVGLILGASWQAVAPRLKSGLGLPGTGIGPVLIFAGGVGLTAVTLVLDQALIGLLRGELQLFRNAFFALVKLLALLAVGTWLPDRSAQVIFVTWSAGQAASLVALAIVIARAHGAGVLVPPRPHIPHSLRSSALVHHVFNLALAAPSWILPLIVTSLVSATANAYFYTAWTVAGFVFVGPLALTTVLYAVASRSSPELGRPLQLTLVLSLLWGAMAMAGCFLFGSGALSLFGRTYGLQGAPVLGVLSLAVFPQAAKLHYVALVRIGGRLRFAILVVLAGGLLELALAALGADRGGVRGLAIGWLIATCAEAAAVAPYLVRAVVRTRPDRPEAGQRRMASQLLLESRQQPPGGSVAVELLPVPWEHWARP
jgi:O-antigen/teichoic acid export membrane protein